jgi:hypothetical protein
MSGERRRLRWSMPEDRAVPKHPYRDTLLVYAGLAVFIVLFAWVTGGNVGRAVLIAIAVFFAASAWSLVRWRQLLHRQAEKER